MIQVQREVAQANRVMAEATLLGIREAQGFCEVPCQEDELQAWFHDAHGVAVMTQATVDGHGNAAVVCETQPPSVFVGLRMNPLVLTRMGHTLRRGGVGSNAAAHRPKRPCLGMVAGRLLVARWP